MLEADFQGFIGREEKLSKIIRYNMEKRTPMFYRTNLLLHSQRVALLVNEISEIALEIYGKDFDSKKTVTLALVHDDAEIVTGDVQLYYKERMSELELAELDKQERMAIEHLSSIWPKEVNGFNYKELLIHALNKDVLEAQIVSYCDKIDAFCEALHELHAGNRKFIEPSLSYVARMRTLIMKFPMLNKISLSKHPFFQMPSSVDVERILSKSGVHTIDSIKKNSDFPFYDLWKDLTWKHIGVTPLIHIKET